MINDRRRPPLDWRKIYPDMEAVEQAHVETLDSWYGHLPAPVTDDERAIRKRIEERGREHARAYLQEHAPELLEQVNRVAEAISKLTGKPVEKF